MAMDFASVRGAKIFGLRTALSLALATTVLPAQTPSKPATTEQITVTADRGLMNLEDDSTSVAVVTAQQIQQTPGLTLDDSLHAVAGFQLFRRTSSWTANPTSQGVSLRGLGSTAASRTLVVSDEVPLNDAFGGWVHWNEIPTQAVRGVAALRGGASDLYGSSAIGGVVDVMPVVAARDLLLDLDALGATENTGSGDAVVSGGSRFGSMLGALSVLSTGGYVTVAPAFRGAIDTPANVVSEAARVELRSAELPHHATAFLRGNVLNEARNNGTPLQTNGTRLWRYQTGADYAAEATTAALRLFGSREGYRQSFTAVNTVGVARSSETLTKLQRVPTDELGLVVQASHLLARHVTVALGFDGRDVRATDAETTVSNGVTKNVSARQRELGGYVDALWQPVRWSLSGSVRVDSFRTFDVRQTASNAVGVTALPTLSELVASPRLGLVRELPRGFTVTATAFRAFRGPTMNELYRTGQVGQQTTLANDTLLAERATGFEFGGEYTRVGVGHLRATYFWTEVNRPVSAVLISQTATTQTLQRQNLGQIRSDGIMVEAQSETRRGVDVGFGYQLAFGTVTAGQAGLVGKWIPEVPRESVTATANWAVRRVAGLHAVVSYSGMAFDDAANTFVLHPYARLDLSADRKIGRGLSVFAGAQNLLDRAIDAGRTPVLTLASPRLVQAGLRYSFR